MENKALKRYTLIVGIYPFLGYIFIASRPVAAGRDF